MSHLVGILDDIKEIRALKSRMENDPKNRTVYEEKMWTHYSHVTKKKEAYLEAKKSSNSAIADAYVTFKSLDGKAKAIEAFDFNWLQRVTAEKLCCLGSIFSNKKILHSGFPIIRDTVDP